VGEEEDRGGARQWESERSIETAEQNRRETVGQGDWVTVRLTVISLCRACKCSGAKIKVADYYDPDTDLIKVLHLVLSLHLATKNAHNREGVFISFTNVEVKI
jgi:hypothetical protein